MKKIKKIIIAIVIGALLLTVGGVILYNTIVDENSLSISEKKWIDTNSSSVISLSIPNDIPVFGSTGEGVFFDFSSSLISDLGLNINNNTVSYLSNIEGYGFFITDTYSQTDLLLFKDHYVLVSKNTGVINDASVIPSLKPGILSTSKDRVKEYFNNDSDFFKEYDNFTKISEDLANGTIEYALVPLNEYKDELISNNVNILKHLSDLNKFYYFHLVEDKDLNSILTKQFNAWKKKNFNKSYDNNNFKLFVDMLKLSEVEQDTLTNKVYKTIKHPYDIEKYSEEEMIYRTLAHDTDEAIGTLIDKLEKKGILDNTVLVLVSDHYVYGYSDGDYVALKKNVLNDQKELQNTPFIIWSKDMEPKKIDKILDTADILPTVLNMLGIAYNPNKYMGIDIFSDNADDFVWFSDGSFIKSKNCSLSDEAILTKSNYNIKKNKDILLTNYYGK